MSSIKNKVWAKEEGMTGNRRRTVLFSYVVIYGLCEEGKGRGLGLILNVGAHLSTLFV